MSGLASCRAVCRMHVLIEDAGDPLLFRFWSPTNSIYRPMLENTSAFRPFVESSQRGEVDVLGNWDPPPIPRKPVVDELPAVIGGGGTSQPDFSISFSEVEPSGESSSSVAECLEILINQFVSIRHRSPSCCVEMPRASIL